MTPDFISEAMLCAHERLWDRLGYDATAFDDDDWAHFLDDVRDGGLVYALNCLEDEIRRSEWTGNDGSY